MCFEVLGRFPERPPVPALSPTPRGRRSPLSPAPRPPTAPGGPACSAPPRRTRGSSRGVGGVGGVGGGRAVTGYRPGVGPGRGPEYVLTCGPGHTCRRAVTRTPRAPVRAVLYVLYVHLYRPPPGPRPPPDTPPPACRWRSSVRCWPASG